MLASAPTPRVPGPQSPLFGNQGAFSIPALGLPPAATVAQSSWQQHQ